MLYTYCIITCKQEVTHMKILYHITEMKVYEYTLVNVIERMIKRNKSFKMRDYAAEIEPHDGILLKHRFVTGQCPV